MESIMKQLAQLQLEKKQLSEEVKEKDKKIEEKDKKIEAEQQDKVKLSEKIEQAEAKLKEIPKAHDMGNRLYNIYNSNNNNNNNNNIKSIENQLQAFIGGIRQMNIPECKDNVIKDFFRTAEYAEFLNSNDPRQPKNKTKNNSNNSIAINTADKVKDFDDDDSSSVLTSSLVTVDTDKPDGFPDHAREMSKLDGHQLKPINHLPLLIWCKSMSEIIPKTPLPVVVELAYVAMTMLLDLVQYEDNKYNNSSTSTSLVKHTEYEEKVLQTIFMEFTSFCCRQIPNFAFDVKDGRFTALFGYLPLLGEKTKGALTGKSDILFAKEGYHCACCVELKVWLEKLTNIYQLIAELTGLSRPMHETNKSNYNSNINNSGKTMKDSVVGVMGVLTNGYQFVRAHLRSTRREDDSRIESIENEFTVDASVVGVQEYWDMLNRLHSTYNTSIIAIQRTPVKDKENKSRHSQDKDEEEDDDDNNKRDDVLTVTSPSKLNNSNNNNNNNNKNNSGITDLSNLSDLTIEKLTLKEKLDHYFNSLQPIVK